jgi:hypothetical protein
MQPTKKFPSFSVHEATEQFEPLITFVMHAQSRVAAQAAGTDAHSYESAGVPPSEKMIPGG